MSYQIAERGRRIVYYSGNTHLIIRDARYIFFIFTGFFSAECDREYVLGRVKFVPPGLSFRNNVFYTQNACLCSSLFSL